MKKQLGICLLLLCTLRVVAKMEHSVHKVPMLDEPGLVISDSAIAIKQSDFDSGPLRITTPGYYYFEEDVVFEPIPEAEAERTDKPQTAWFAAMTIECDNVIIDLNKKTFEASEAFVNSHDFKVFALIELNNSPFPHFIFAFSGETELKNAHNVIIKNGTLGRSSHHGIHGNSNSNVQLYNLVIKDWEVAAISLNGLKSGVIKNVLISGVEHAVPFTGLVALMQSTRVVLEQLKDGGDENAQAYIDALDAMIVDPEQNGRTHPSGTHDGNVYGIFINRALDVGPIVTYCTEQTAEAIVIEDVMISGIHTKIIETVGIADNDGNRLKGNLFGVLRWQDAYQNGVFAPNALLKAQVYGVQQGSTPEIHPAGFADNILSETPNEALFLSQVKPIFNGDFAGHTNKGAFGLRLDCVHGVTVRNCMIMDITNESDAGKTLADIPSGSQYTFEVGNYTGTDVRGMSLAACHNCCLEGNEILECFSEHGDVYGVAIFNESDVNLIKNCVSSDHYAHQDDVTSSVNPSSRVYGFYVDTDSHSNRFVDCVSQKMVAPRYAYGFYVHNCTDTMMDHCMSTNNQATSSEQLEERKVACGFASVAASATRFADCIARQMHCTNEANYGSESESFAAGFMLGEEGNAEDYYSTITHCLSECHNGGKGKAYGIYLQDANDATVTHNTAINNHTDNSKRGYGIYRTSGDEDALVLGNVAYGNTKKNYEDKNKKWPILELDYNDVDSSKINNTWYNICIKW